MRRKQNLQQRLRQYKQPNSARHTHKQRQPHGRPQQLFGLFGSLFRVRCREHRQHTDGHRIGQCLRQIKQRQRHAGIRAICRDDFLHRKSRCRQPPIYHSHIQEAGNCHHGRSQGNRNHKLYELRKIARLFGRMPQHMNHTAPHTPYQIQYGEQFAAGHAEHGTCRCTGYTIACAQQIPCHSQTNGQLARCLCNLRDGSRDHIACALIPAAQNRLYRHKKYSRCNGQQARHGLGLSKGAAYSRRCAGQCQRQQG